MKTPVTSHFFDRDLSWLSFNGRLLEEADRDTVPLMERLNFLAIYSSNLDEFYRVRMPALHALENLANDQASPGTQDIKKTIHAQQELFGQILSHKILPALEVEKCMLLFNKSLPATIRHEVNHYFFEHIAGHLRITELNGVDDFFPENNKLYLVVSLQHNAEDTHYFIINVPSDKIPRFFSTVADGYQYILFIEDIIRENIQQIFPDAQRSCACTFKITRDAEMDLKDEYEGNLAKKIEHEITNRDNGLASRFLYEASMPEDTVNFLRDHLGLQETTCVRGGTYHNLKDLSSLPVKKEHLYYDRWPRHRYPLPEGVRLLDYLRTTEILLHPPYHSYDPVLRFFNEASIDADVTRIFITLYRVANESRIATALINAARNGKKVVVFMELKARFDEANNIKWAKRMKEAGVVVLFSIPGLKVHAKVCLVKRKKNNNAEYFGLLSTGNFNENTARLYTDHVLLTSDQTMLKEAEQLFLFLKKGRRPKPGDNPGFRHLLVAQFNLKDRFTELIDREISHAAQGHEAMIDIKLNNLEDSGLIDKLYDASRAGVKIRLLVRGICCLIPGVAGMSENITVTRIVDRYLEHGRIFYFHNRGQYELFLGSADWMTRNIYRRIEVCFPVYSDSLRKELIRILNFQFQDSHQAVILDKDLRNVPVRTGAQDIQSQKIISDYVSQKP